MYKIVKEGKCYKVVGKRGKIHAECTSLKKAEAQVRLLEGVDSGKWKPTGKKGGMIQLSPPQTSSQHQLVYNAIALLPLSQPSLNTYSKFSGAK